MHLLYSRKDNCWDAKSHHLAYSWKIWISWLFILVLAVKTHLNLKHTYTHSLFLFPGPVSDVTDYCWIRSRPDHQCSINHNASAWANLVQHLHSYLNLSHYVWKILLCLFKIVFCQNKSNFVACHSDITCSGLTGECH